MYGSVSESNVRYNPMWKHSSLRERNEQGCYDAWTARYLQLGYESLRLLIPDQYEVFHPSSCFVLPRTALRSFTPAGINSWSVDSMLAPKVSVFSLLTSRIRSKHGKIKKNNLGRMRIFVHHFTKRGSIMSLHDALLHWFFCNSVSITTFSSNEEKVNSTDVANQLLHINVL
jgi:hypothetical protein